MFHSIHPSTVNIRFNNNNFHFNKFQTYQHFFIAQCIHRTYRLGQEKTCYVYRIIADKTMETKILNRAKEKQSLSGKILDDENIEQNAQKTIQSMSRKEIDKFYE